MHTYIYICLAVSPLARLCALEDCVELFQLSDMIVFLCIRWAKKLLSKLCNVYKPLQRLSCLRVNQVSAKDVEASLDKGKMREHHTKQLMYIRQEHLKPKLGDFTLDEFTEKIIQYGFLMVCRTHGICLYVIIDTVDKLFHF